METKRIQSVWVFKSKNDDPMVMVFDYNGEQMPEYQGRKSDVWQRILDHADPQTEFEGVNAPLSWEPVRQYLKELEQGE